jgi:hypothetical protein
VIPRILLDCTVLIHSSHRSPSRSRSRRPAARLPVLAWRTLRQLTCPRRISHFLAPWLFGGLTSESAFIHFLSFNRPAHLLGLFYSIDDALLILRLCHRCVSTWIPHSDRWFGLLSLWRIKERLLRIPALVCFRRKLFHALPPRHIKSLFLYRGRFVASVS